jgi:hypothetical protein
MLTRRQGIGGAVMAAVAAVVNGFVRGVGAESGETREFTGLGYSTFPVLADGSLGEPDGPAVDPAAIAAGFAQGYRIREPDVFSGRYWDGYYIEAIGLVAPEPMGEFLAESKFSELRERALGWGYRPEEIVIRVYFA